MIVKINKSQDGKIVVCVCDSSIIGKIFEEGKKQLDLSSDFYKGEERSDKEICDLMRTSYIINLVGERAVRLALKEGLISHKSIIKISEIPYAQAIVCD